MQATEVALVKRSFAEVAPLADGLATTFYERLFACTPALRALFHGDMADQRRKLIQMLAVVVAGLDRPEGIIAAVQALGARHAGYGVRSEHYQLVGEALLWALAETLGERCTPDVTAAWGSAYTLLAVSMDAGVARQNAD